MADATPLDSSNVTKQTQPDDAEGACDPRAQYKSPEMLMAATDLSTDEKRDQLQQWLGDLSDRLNAESEGMSASDPITPHREANLADELSRVNAALLELDKDAQ